MQSNVKIKKELVRRGWRKERGIWFPPNLSVARQGSGGWEFNGKETQGVPV